MASMIWVLLDCLDCLLLVVDSATLPCDSGGSAEGIRREVVELFDPIGHSLAIGKI
jgi:hypothetical protein